MERLRHRRPVQPLREQHYARQRLPRPAHSRRGQQLHQQHRVFKCPIRGLHDRFRQHPPHRHPALQQPLRPLCEQDRAPDLPLQRNQRHHPQPLRHLRELHMAGHQRHAGERSGIFHQLDDQFHRPAGPDVLLQAEVREHLHAGWQPLNRHRVVALVRCRSYRVLQ